MEKVLFKFLLRIKFILIALIFGFLLINISSAQPLTLPAQEQEVTFRSGDFTLYGTLSVPARLDTQKLPAIVLAHGSGPNDRDETIVVNGITLKPFKELANALKKEGFVVLRYDKRNFTMSQQGATRNQFNALLPDVFIEDARAAVDFVKGLDFVDTECIYLIGHSEGATFAPYIVAGKDLTGAVLIAPGLLQFKEALIYQTEYQIKVYESMNAFGQFNQEILRMKSFLKEANDVFASIDNGTFPKGGYVAGASLAYYLRLQDLTKNIPKEIIAITIPVLIINGTKDMLCPVDLLREKESFLKQKVDLKIVYIDNMVHQLYRAGSADFETGVPENITNWIKEQ